MTHRNNSDDEQQRGIALLAAIAEGSKPALTEFYQCYEKLIYRYAATRLNDSFAAADILNEVMIDVWRSAAGRFEGRAKVSTWLLGIARHKVVDYLRKKKPKEFIEVDDNLPDESPLVDMEQLVIGVKDAQLLRRTMAALSDVHREVLHFVFFEDFNYSETAAIIGVPEGTVKSRVFHAKNQLKIHLAKIMSH